MWKLMVGMSALAATLLGCENSLCPGLHSCGDQRGGAVRIPGDLAAPLVSVTASAPCTAAMYPAELPGLVVVGISGKDDVTCQVRGLLANGDHVQAAVTYQYYSDPTGCCSHIAPVGDAPTFEPAN